MERRRAIVVATVVAAAFVGGAAAIAANNDLVGGRHDGVGKLDPVATATVAATPSTITKYLDPVTGQLLDSPPTSGGPTGAWQEISTAADTAGHHSDRVGRDDHGDDHGGGDDD